MPAVDAAVRVAAVQRLASASDLTAALAAVPDGVGITVSGTGLVFRPPMPVGDLVGAFGWEGTVAQTVGVHGRVHMGDWVVATVAEGRTERPRLGRWRVDAYLDGRPSGAEVPGVHAPAALVAALGADDAVRSVSFV